MYIVAFMLKYKSSLCDSTDMGTGDKWAQLSVFEHPWVKHVQKL